MKEYVRFKTKRDFLFVVVILMLVLATLIHACFCFSNKKEVATIATEESREILYEDFLLTFLIPYFQDAINDYYGDSNKSFDLFDVKVLKIERLEQGSFYFTITVQLVTYEGAHNPSYGLETITIIQDVSGIRVVDFKHELYKIVCKRGTGMPVPYEKHFLPDVVHWHACTFGVKSMRQKMPSLGWHLL